MGELRWQDTQEGRRFLAFGRTAIKDTMYLMGINNQRRASKVFQELVCIEQGMRVELNNG